MTSVIKAALIGPISVGKTSILERLKNDHFSIISEPTIGVCYTSIQVDTITFNIWDTAGEERYKAMASIYYRNAHILIFVFDVGSPDTIDLMCDFIQEAMQTSPAGRSRMHFIIVGNKIDNLHLDESILLQMFRHNSIVRDYGLEGLDIIFTSARTGVGIGKVKEKMIQLGNIGLTQVDENIIQIRTDSASTTDDRIGCKC